MQNKQAKWLVLATLVAASATAIMQDDAAPMAEPMSAITLNGLSADELQDALAEPLSAITLNGLGADELQDALAEPMSAITLNGLSATELRDALNLR